MKFFFVLGEIFISLNHNHKIIDGTGVKWVLLQKSNKKVAQCFRCQNWGHMSANCGLPARCVKCSDSHNHGSCPRVSRDGDAKCVNCNGDHTANFRGCPVYADHLKKNEIQSQEELISFSPAKPTASTGIIGSFPFFK